ncbi:hypothetical protein HK096_001402 [Nowakowskiella sp. JEL0078]|nr:hypothetical protein HK096_001402 [Nowakowskiella sp. JEL0078]
MPTSIDLCFVLDVTKSMDPWLSAATNNCDQIMKYCLELYPNLPLRVAFVAYKDFAKDTKIPWYYVVDFTDSETLHSHLIGLKCDGGDDFCEDIAGAFSQLENLDWRSKTGYFDNRRATS